MLTESGGYIMPFAATRMDLESITASEVKQRRPSVTWYHLKKVHMGLPRWFSGQESACQCRGHGLDHRSRKIPCAMEELTLGARTTEARAPELRSEMLLLAATETGAAVRPQRGQTG